MAKPTRQAATKRAIEEFFGKEPPKKLTYAQLRARMDEAASIDPSRRIDTMTAMVFLEIRPVQFSALKAIDPPKQPFKVEGSFGREGKPAARASITNLRKWLQALVDAGHVDPNKELPWDAPDKVVQGDVDFITVHEGRSTRIIGAVFSHDALVDLYFRDPRAVVIQRMTIMDALDQPWTDDQDKEDLARAYAVWSTQEADRLAIQAASLAAIADRCALNRSTPPV
ncbi:hypothetical protein N799_05325 [Lysobacter arseniciresistens ZS79]|uniref:Uncharacterized protein n=1 Tax=Lysobacter arseniciresistens ZS79 TaxID=913325 RepID=A0A0A0F7Z5_9GAMM|nr:hypothetical protein [Lysobacter arseniciresistens]KGM57487.1 hypothetical protein N799_05325 [Lysobacter arseniciresistens ZS79]